jgi:hypothetical protein
MKEKVYCPVSHRHIIKEVRGFHYLTCFDYCENCREDIKTVQSNIAFFLDKDNKIQSELFAKKNREQHPDFYNEIYDSKKIFE